MDEEGVKDITYILKEERPNWSVERKHLAIAAHLVGDARHCRYHKHGEQQGYHNPTCRGCGGIPPFKTYEGKSHKAKHGTHDEHRVEADEAALEKLPHGHLSPSIVVGIADDKTREDEEEVYGDVGMIERSDDATAHAIGGLGKGKALEDVVEQDDDGSHTSQPIEQVVMRFGRKSRIVIHIFRLWNKDTQFSYTSHYSHKKYGIHSFL